MKGGQTGQGRQQKSLKSVWGESTIRINVQEWRLLYEGMKSGDEEGGRGRECADI